SSVGRPPVTRSQLVRVDPATLQVETSVTPENVPDHNDGRVFAVYGVDVDDEAGTVWATNTREDTVAVYRQSDLSLVKQFEPGLAPHARDVVIVPGQGKAYVTSPTEPLITVFDTAKLEPRGSIELKSGRRGEKFGAMSAALDAKNGKL